MRKVYPLLPLSRFCMEFNFALYGSSQIPKPPPPLQRDIICACPLGVNKSFNLFHHRKFVPLVHFELEYKKGIEPLNRTEPLNQCRKLYFMENAQNAKKWSMSFGAISDVKYWQMKCRLAKWKKSLLQFFISILNIEHSKLLCLPTVNSYDLCQNSLWTGKSRTEVRILKFSTDVCCPSYNIDTMLKRA